MTIMSLPLVDNPPARSRSAQEGGPCRHRGPLTLATTAEAVRGNVLAQRMRMPPLGYMELILTENCNLRCSYCWQKDKPDHDMSEETAMAAVGFLMEFSGNIKQLTVLFFGGEPMLRFDLLKQIHAYGSRRAQALGKTISWDMTTNGTLITPDRARWLAEHKVKYLLSMDGAKEDHDRHRRFPDGTGSFDCIAEKLPMLKHYQPWQGVKMSLTPDTIGNLRENVDTLYGLGINQFILGYAHGIPWRTADLLAYEAAMLDLCELYLEKKYRKEFFRMTFFEDAEPGNNKEMHYWGCGAGRGRICVDSFGDLYGCSKMANITGARNGVLPMGNVFQGFTRIENRRQLLVPSVGPRDKCKGCDYANDCAGGCPALNFFKTGSIFAPDDLSCRFVFILQRVHQYMKRRHQEVFAQSTGAQDAVVPAVEPKAGTIS